MPFGQIKLGLRYVAVLFCCKDTFLIVFGLGRGAPQTSKSGWLSGLISIEGLIREAIVTDGRMASDCGNPKHDSVKRKVVSKAERNFWI